MIEDFLQLFEALRLRAASPSPLELTLVAGAILLGIALVARQRARWRRDVEESGRRVEAERAPPGERADYRVPMHISAEVFLEDRNANLQGTLVELSAGGATVTVLVEAPATGYVLLRFRPDGEEKQTLPAEIVRMEHAHGSPRRHLHFRFRAITPDTEQMLRRVIAARQRAVRRA